ncbi:hypothetical protein Dimus_003382 [Dionaea muscipula]
MRKMHQAMAEDGELRAKLECRRSSRLSPSLPSNCSDLGTLREAVLTPIEEEVTSIEDIQPQLSSPATELTDDFSSFVETCQAETLLAIDGDGGNGVELGLQTVVTPSLGPDGLMVEGAFLVAKAGHQVEEALGDGDLDSSDTIHVPVSSLVSHVSTMDDLPALDGLEVHGGDSRVVTDGLGANLEAADGPAAPRSDVHPCRQHLGWRIQFCVVFWGGVGPSGESFLCSCYSYGLADICGA